QLFEELNVFGVLEFVRSGRVAISKPMKTLESYLTELEENHK
ncbi:MAG: acetolactate synthase small subunit, partial [Flavobacteriia bacterium]